MRLTSLAMPALLIGMVASTGFAAAQNYGPPPPAYGQGYDRGQGGWDNVPPEFREIQRRGFHDGIEGARRDFDNHRQPNVNNRDEFRRPPVPRSDWHDYRMGFRRGYDAGVRHIYGEHWHGWR